MNLKMNHVSNKSMSNISWNMRFNIAVSPKKEVKEICTEDYANSNREETSNITGEAKYGEATNDADLE